MRAGCTAAFPSFLINQRNDISDIIFTLRIIVSQLGATSVSGPRGDQNTGVNFWI